MIDPFSPKVVNIPLEYYLTLLGMGYHGHGRELKFKMAPLGFQNEERNDAVFLINVNYFILGLMTRNWVKDRVKGG